MKKKVEGSYEFNWMDRLNRETKGKDNGKQVTALDKAVFFFFKQKTAYESSECDWSSDVCSSDLMEQIEQEIPVVHQLINRDALHCCCCCCCCFLLCFTVYLYSSDRVSLVILNYDFVMVLGSQTILKFTFEQRN